MKNIQLTGSLNESWLDIYHNKLNHHLLGMHHNSHDCVRVQGVDNMDAVAFSIACVTFHDYLADELTPELTTKEKQTH